MIAGEARLGTPDGADAAAVVAEGVHRYQRAYFGITKRDREGVVAVTPEFFDSRFRVFLPSTELDGERLSGPNAA